MAGNEIVVAAEPHSGGAAMAPWKGLEMVVSPREALRRVQELQAFVAEVMVKDEDFGVIPGTQKPTLYQPGAQKLAELYGFSHRFITEEKIERWEEPLLFFYSMRCVLTSRHDGRFIGEGLGSCNSREDKYAWRWVGDRDLPKGIDKNALKSKTRDGKNGKWVQYRLPNEDIASVVNTVMKMACKRAYVHAVISATRSAGVFTQDLENLPEEVFGEEAPTRSWASGGSEETDVKTVAAQKAAEARAKKGGAPQDPEVTTFLAKLADIGEWGSGDDLDAIIPELEKRWPEKHALYRTMVAAYGAANDKVNSRDGKARERPVETKPADTAAPPAEQGKAAPASAPAPAAPPVVTAAPTAPAAAKAATPTAKRAREPGEEG